MRACVQVRVRDCSFAKQAGVLSKIHKLAGVACVCIVVPTLLKLRDMSRGKLAHSPSRVLLEPLMLEGVACVCTGARARLLARQAGWGADQDT